MGLLVILLVRLLCNHRAPASTLPIRLPYHLSHYWDPFLDQMTVSVPISRCNTLS